MSPQFHFCCSLELQPSRNDTRSGQGTIRLPAAKISADGVIAFGGRRPARGITQPAGLLVPKNRIVPYPPGAAYDKRPVDRTSHSFPSTTLVPTLLQENAAAARLAAGDALWYALIDILFWEECAMDRIVPGPYPYDPALSAPPPPPRDYRRPGEALRRKLVRRRSGSFCLTPIWCGGLPSNFCRLEGKRFLFFR